MLRDKKHGEAGAIIWPQVGTIEHETMSCPDLGAEQNREQNWADYFNNMNLQNDE